MSQYDKMMFWHKTNHNELAAEPSFQSFPPDTVATLFKIRILVAQSRQKNGLIDGSISIGADRRVKFDGLIDHVATWPGMDRRRARKACTQLKGSYLKVSKTGYVKLVGWANEQDLAPSPAADRKRRQRDNDAVEAIKPVIAIYQGKTVTVDALRKHIEMQTEKRPKSVAHILDLLSSAGIMTDVEHGKVRIDKFSPVNNSRPAPPPVPPSSSDSESDPFERDMSHPAGVTCHVESELREREITSLRVSSPSGGTGGGAGDHASAAQPAGGLNIWEGDPVHCALILCNESGSKRSRNTYALRLRELIEAAGQAEGVRHFRDAMTDLKADLTDGRPIRNRGAILCKKLNERLDAVRGVRSFVEGAA